MLISWKLTTPTIKVEPEDEHVEEKKKNPILTLDDYDRCAGCKAYFKGYKPPPPPPAPVKVPTPQPPPPVVTEPESTPLLETDDPIAMAGLGLLADGLLGQPAIQAAPAEATPVPEPTLTAPEITEEEEEYRRGQIPQSETQGLGRKVKEFYSFNTISGELLHVTALQAVLSVFELRMLKTSAGFEFDEANQNLGFCQNCGTLISQLYKLHQEVGDMLKKGSNVSKMIEFEEQLTDTQETDPGSLKKRKVLKTASKVNGVSLIEDMDHDGVGGADTWMGNNNDDGDSWHDDGGHDDSYSYDNDSMDTEVNVKPRVSIEPRTVGIKITSVGSARTLVCEDMSSDGEGSQSGRKRRSTCRKVDYAKVLDGPSIDGGDDDEYIPEPKVPHERRSRGGSKATARKKTAAAPPSHKGRGRPPKNPKASKVVVPPPKHQRERDPAFKIPAEKSNREATCQVCRKVFPSHYLAEHMNVAHNAVLGQPCLICGKFFESSYKAIKHLLTHVPEKAFGCSRCHATFKTAEERNSHTNTHTEAEKKLECPKCSQPFTSLLLMNKHEAQKHRQTKSFLCSICAKLLTGKDEWIQHILSHGPFQCYYCRDFLQPGEYKRHVQTVHMHAAGKPRQSSSSSAGASTVLAEVTLD